MSSRTRPLFGRRRPIALAAASLTTAALASALAVSASSAATPVAPQLIDGFESGELSGWSAVGEPAVQQEVVRHGRWALIIPRAEGVQLLESELERAAQTLEVSFSYRRGAKGRTQLVRFPASDLAIGDAGTGSLYLKHGRKRIGLGAIAGAGAWNRLVVQFDAQADRLKVQKNGSDRGAWIRLPGLRSERAIQLGTADGSHGPTWFDAFAPPAAPAPVVPAEPVEPVEPPASPTPSEPEGETSPAGGAPAPDPAAARLLPAPGKVATGPAVSLILPTGIGSLGQSGPTALRASVNGQPISLGTQNGSGITRDGNRLKVVVNGNTRSEWLVYNSRDLKHLKGHRIGFGFDFEWRALPSSWAIFPFQAHDTDQHGSPSFAFEKGKIGIRNGSRGSGGFAESWRYEPSGNPVVGRRYRVAGFFDYKPTGGAALQAFVQYSDRGAPFTGWRKFADVTNRKIGYTSNSVKGIYGKGGGYTKSGRLEGYVYGWAFGQETPALAAQAAGFAGPTG